MCHIVEMLSCQLEIMRISTLFGEVVEMLQDVLPDVPCHGTPLEQSAGPSNVLRQQHLKRSHGTVVTMCVPPMGRGKTNLRMIPTMKIILTWSLKYDFSTTEFLLMSPTNGEAIGSAQTEYALIAKIIGPLIAKEIL